VSGWLKHRTVIVTGASRGIGAATAVAVGLRGARVIAVARTQSKLQETVAEICRRGGSAESIECDLSGPEAVPALYEAVKTMGGADGLVCAAAMLGKADVEKATGAAWREVMRLNVDAVWECCRQLFLWGVATGSERRIVTLGSLSGIYATEKFAGLAAYNASKFALIGLTEALAVEGRDCGIFAVCVSPGAVATEMLREANPQLTARLYPADVGGLIAELLDGAGFPAMSGAVIPLFSNA
jgi:NAD(P)-dependent dehydrogenase (short-subunit alcohol dehydrogenase family)